MRAPRRDANRDDRSAIAAAIEKIDGELGDTSPKLSVTWAISLFQQLGPSRDHFVDMLCQARGTTREKRGRMGYFVGVLEKWLVHRMEMAP